MVAATNERNGPKWQTLKTLYRYSPETLPARCFPSLPRLNKFSMTGSTPNSAWLNGCVACDQADFIKTGLDLTSEDLAKAS